MNDVHTTEQRSRNMSAIRHQNTKPELLIRSELHKRGFRFRIHRKDLPGKPDIVLPKHNAAIFVNGCFWHGHECALFRWPKTREDFWRNKISGNVVRDSKNSGALLAKGYRVLTVWECVIKGKYKLHINELADRIADWIRSNSAHDEIPGSKDETQYQK
jgi:DNA mismatch endonuclease (patch repair protein)